VCLDAGYPPPGVSRPWAVVPIHRKVLVPVVHAVVWWVFAAGQDLVCAWLAGPTLFLLLSRTKGDQQHTNYRGIAVGDLLGKVSH
jgi:hypothetical protein